MNKQLLFIPGLFALGILVGIFMMKSQQDDGAPAVEHRVIENSPFQNSADKSVIHLADQVAALNSRISELQQRIAVLENTQGEVSLPTPLSNPLPDTPSSVDTPVTARARVLSAQNLVKSGVDAVLAEEIVRRKNQLELDKLQLRDAAVRGNYLGEQRYMDALQELLADDVPLRVELGDETYDRYLFNNGQANRVRVASVMHGSAAQQAGMEDGDLIYSYDEQRLFEWGELQELTSKGQLDEFVSVTITRGGVQQVMWVPRGPLGVRLSTTRVNPDL